MAPQPIPLPIPLILLLQDTDRIQQYHIIYVPIHILWRGNMTAAVEIYVSDTGAGTSIPYHHMYVVVKVDRIDI